MIKFFWYVLISILSVAIATFTIYKKRNNYKASTLIVFYIFAAAIAWIGEYIVLGFFNSYAYKTDLLTNTWAENLIGHLLLNTSMFPAAAVVMAAFSLSFGWILLITFLFILTEYFFMELGIYEQHWWRFYMSVINTVAFLLISRKWFSVMSQKCFGLVRTVTFYFVAIVFIHTPSPILLLLGKQHYHLGFIEKYYPDFYLSSTIFSFGYHTILAFFIVLFVCVSKKWYWRVLPFIISAVVEIILLNIKILIIEDSWNFIYTLIINEIFLAAFILLEKYTLRPDSSKQK